MCDVWKRAQVSLGSKKTFCIWFEHEMWARNDPVLVLSSFSCCLQRPTSDVRGRGGYCWWSQDSFNDENRGDLDHCCEVTVWFLLGFNALVKWEVCFLLLLLLISDCSYRALFQSIKLCCVFCFFIWIWTILISRLATLNQGFPK